MKSLSPIDAVGPAFARTRSLLLPPGLEPGLTAPFRFWFLIKIATVAALTDPGVYGASLSLFVDAVLILFFLAGGVHLPGFESPVGSSPGILVLVVLLGAVGLSLWILLGWLWCRLRFAFFEMVVERHGSVGRAWSRYAVGAWRYLGLTILVSLAFLVLLAMTAGPIFFHMYRAMGHLSSKQLAQDPTALLGTILPLYGIVFAALFVFAVVDAILQDFVIPPMALEDATVEQAIRRFVNLARSQPGYVALYVLLRFALQVGLGMAGGLVIVVVFAILVLGGFGIGFALHATMLHRSALLWGAFVAIATVAGFALYLVAILLLNGLIAVFRESYAVQFYGAYYPSLGVRVDPHVDPPAAPERSSLPPM